MWLSTLALRRCKFYGIALEAVKWNETCLVGVCGYAARTRDWREGHPDLIKLVR